MTNEAAERLRGIIREQIIGGDGAIFTAVEALEQALAAERRATVERVRERLEEAEHLTTFEEPMLVTDSQWRAILDEEAAR